MADWADEMASKIVDADWADEISSDRIIARVKNIIAAALRKAKADGMREAAVFTGEILDEFRIAHDGAIRNRAAAIEKGTPNGND